MYRLDQRWKDLLVTVSSRPRHVKSANISSNTRLRSALDCACAVVRYCGGDGKTPKTFMLIHQAMLSDF